MLKVNGVVVGPVAGRLTRNIKRAQHIFGRAPFTITSCRLEGRQALLSRTFPFGTGVPAPNETPLGSLELFPNVFADQPLRSFQKREFVRERGFEKYSSCGLIQHVCRRNQSRVFSNTQVHQTDGFA